MITNNKLDSSVRWDELVLVVYSVLVGLSLDKSFDFFASSTDKISSAILLVGIMIVVLENWVYLPLYFKVIDIDSKGEVTMYVSAAITYSCIPGLYLAKTQQVYLSAPEWVLLNFAVICLIDAITKLFTLGKLKQKFIKSQMTDDEKDLAGTYVFYAYTGIFYTFVLGAIVIGLSLSAWNIIIKSIIVTSSWLAIRTIDRMIIPKTINALAYFYLGKR